MEELNLLQQQLLKEKKIRRIVTLVVSVIVVAGAYLYFNPIHFDRGMTKDYEYSRKYNDHPDANTIEFQIVRDACLEYLEELYDNDLKDKVITRFPLAGAEKEYADQIPGIIAGLYAKRIVIKDLNYEYKTEIETEIVRPDPTLRLSYGERVQIKDHERKTEVWYTNAHVLMDLKLTSPNQNNFGLKAATATNEVPMEAKVAFSYYLDKRGYVTIFYCNERLLTVIEKDESITELGEYVFPKPDGETIANPNRPLKSRDSFVLIIVTPKKLVLGDSKNEKNGYPTNLNITDLEIALRAQNDFSLLTIPYFIK
jgi:hypothetical protein